MPLPRQRPAKARKHSKQTKPTSPRRMKVQGVEGGKSYYHRLEQEGGRRRVSIEWRFFICYNAAGDCARSHSSSLHDTRSANPPYYCALDHWAQADGLGEAVVALQMALIKAFW